jgi:outer membrane protein assembly factor BamB
VDGHIYALDMRTGKLLWSADSGGAMISSQGFIPGIDGALYSIEESDAGLVRAPLTVKDLVHSAPFRSENLAYVGNKRASLFAVDLDSGKIFDRLLDKEKECGLIEEEESKILLLSRTDFEIQAFEADSGKMSWNASFAEFRFFDQLSTLNPTSIYREKWIPVLASTAAGGVRAYNPCTGEQLWDALLPSAISDAFVQMDSGETIVFHSI